MTGAARLLVVRHSQTGSTDALAQALADGARDPEIEGVEVVVASPFDVDADDVAACRALVLATPENFGYMSGALKDFFDRVYEPLRARCRGLPYALVVKAGNDGQGAVRAVERIVTGLSWRAVQPPLVVAGPLSEEHLEQARELGMTVAGGVAMELW